jgi:hypothetical protein
MAERYDQKEVEKGEWERHKILINCAAHRRCRTPHISLADK